MKNIFTATACLQVLLTHPSAHASQAPATTGTAPPRTITQHGRPHEHRNPAAAYQAGLAGKYKNWTYATYELNELRNAINRVAKTLPVFNSRTPPRSLRP